MNHQSNRISIAIACAVALSSCSTLEGTESAEQLDASTMNLPLNQPAVISVVELNSNIELTNGMDTTATANNSQSNAVSISMSEQKKTADSVSGDPVVSSVNSPVLSTPTHVFSSQDSSSIADFTLLKGETYKNALYRWLGDEGYEQVGFLLNESYQFKLDSRVEKNESFQSTLKDALTHLIDKVDSTELTDDEEDTLELHDFKQEDGEYLHLDFPKDKQVIVTTSTLPLTMFTVIQGDVKTNYIRLGNHYGWKVNSDFYLAPNYEVPFSFNIVTEKGNVKDALNQLLAPYPGLTGGIYSSNRQIFIESAEQ